MANQEAILGQSVLPEGVGQRISPHRGAVNFLVSYWARYGVVWVCVSRRARRGIFGWRFAVAEQYSRHCLPSSALVFACLVG